MKFILGLIYLIILVIAIAGPIWPRPNAQRISSFAQWILFLIIGILLILPILEAR